MSWCTIESDPGVFTELIASMGVKGVQVEEIYDLEKATFDKLKPVYGLIFLFKWQKSAYKDDRPVITDPEQMKGLYFAKQVINNACATQALINILLNCPALDLGPELKSLKEFFTDVKDPDSCGLAIGSCQGIRTAHNSFARPEPFVSEEEVAATDDDEVYHFVAYVPAQGHLYELDGLRAGPIDLGSCTPEDWLDKARPAIQDRIKNYSQSEIRFNLMAVIQKRKDLIDQKLGALNVRRAQIDAKLNRLTGDSNAKMDVDDGGSLPDDPEQLAEGLKQVEDEENALKKQLEEEEEKFKQWKMENIRRKHDYIPFIFNMLKVLAENNKLLPLVESSLKASK